MDNVNQYVMTQCACDGNVAARKVSVLVRKRNPVRSCAKCSLTKYPKPAIGDRSGLYTVVRFEKNPRNSTRVVAQCACLRERKMPLSDWRKGPQGCKFCMGLRLTPSEWVTAVANSYHITCPCCKKVSRGGSKQVREREPRGYLCRKCYPLNEKIFCRQICPKCAKVVARRANPYLPVKPCQACL